MRPERLRLVLLLLLLLLLLLGFVRAINIRCRGSLCRRSSRSGRWHSVLVVLEPLESP